MKSTFPRFLCRQMGRFISAQTLFKMETPVFHPFYHVVSDEDLPHILNYNYRNVKQFKAELDFYLQHFKPVSLDVLHSKKRVSEKIFHLSFDDGLKECAEIIAPILLEKGIPATFFVNVDFIDNKALFHKYKASLILRKLRAEHFPEAEKWLDENRLNKSNILKATILQAEILDKAADLMGLNFDDFLKIRQPYLTTTQLIQLKNQGFSIGAHSFNHPEFWKISESEQLRQVKKSIHWISEKINPNLKTFAFPFTDSGAGKTVLQTVLKEKICDLTFGTAGLKYDETELHFQRYPVEIPGEFLPNLKAEFLYFKLRKQMGKAIVKH